MPELACDVLVVGAGPAGLAAAAAAAEDGVDVLVVDENPHPGGQIWRPARGTGPRPETRALLQRAQSNGARFVAGASVFDAPEPTRLRALDEAGGVLELRAERVVIATGATERFLPFPGWTLPGVFGVGGLQAMVKGGMDVAGQRVVLAGSGPLLLAVAASLRAHGAEVLGIFEQASRAAVRRFGVGLWHHPRKLAQVGPLLAKVRGIPRHYAAWPEHAHGDGRLQRVTLNADGREVALHTDLLACAFGLVPSTGLAALCGCDVEAGRVRVDAVQRTSVPVVFSAGEPNGIGGVDVATAEGTVAGHAAAGREDRARRAMPRRDRERRFAARLERAYALRDALLDLPARDDTIVCRCEDVRWSDVRARRDARQAKLETRCGMGPCQGRVCGAALEFLCGWSRDRVRPPLVPVPIHALAGEPGPHSPSTQEIDS